MMSVQVILIESTAYAQSNTSRFFIKENDLLANEKRDYTYIEGKLGDNNLVYTYVSNNKTFKVIEKSSDNYDRVDSIIYIKNSVGVFVKYATQKLIVENNIITITINENGKVSTEKIVVSRHEKTIGKEKLFNQQDRILDYQNMLNGGPTWDGMPVSNWIYWGEQTGSSNIIRYTSAAVIAIIATIAASLFGIAGQCVVAGASAIAALIIEDSIEKIWWTANIYYQTCIPPEDWMFRRKVADI